MYARYSREVDRARETAKTSIKEEDGQQEAMVNGQELKAAIDEELQRLWDRLQNPPPEMHCNSLLKRNLTQEIFNELKDKKTRFGGTLKDCIRSGELGY